MAFCVRKSSLDQQGTDFLLQNGELRFDNVPNRAVVDFRTAGNPNVAEADGAPVFRDAAGYCLVITSESR